MDAKLQRRIQRYGWDAASHSYESSWRVNLAPAHTTMLDMAQLKPTQNVLDVASGSGLLALKAAEIVGNGGRVTATDISEEMVSLVAEAASRKGLRNVRGLRVEAESLSFPNGTFNLVLCGLGLMFVPDPDLAVREMARVLVPGGRAVAAVWGERKKCGWAEIFPIVDSVVQSEVCPLFFGLGTGPALALTFERASFLDVETRRFDSVVAFNNERGAVTALVDAGAVAMAAKRFSAEVRRDVEERFLASIAPYRSEDGAYAIPAEFVVVSGRKA
jgi:SAM-dependent methyltransferase